MSSQQIQRCIRDVLGIDHNEPVDWSESHMKKLVSATGTLYHTSLGKVMLKQGEETARCHLCAYMASQRLQRKHKPELQYYLDRVPLEPTKSRKLIQLFEQNLLQSSPIKNFSWTPSPKKRKTQSPIKGDDRFTAMNPNELREQLFGTPTRKITASPLKNIELSVSPQKSSTLKIRRKLAFEEDVDDDEIEAQTPTKKGSGSGAGVLNVLSDLGETNTPLNASPTKVQLSQAAEYGAKKRREGSKAKSDLSLLHKRYYKVTPVEIINSCNQFELPKDVAYNVLDHYMNYASNLVCPWQLVCGLILNATFVVFVERRRRDPRVDHLILAKMCALMKCSNLDDIIICVNVVKELIEGEKWYRDLQIKHDYYNGASYDEAISARLGSMLQPNNILVSDDQFANWERKINQDLSLRDNLK